MVDAICQRCAKKIRLRDETAVGGEVGEGDAQGAQTPEARQAQKVVWAEKVTMEGIARFLDDLGENASADAFSEWFFAAADLVREKA